MKTKRMHSTAAALSVLTLAGLGVLLLALPAWAGITGTTTYQCGVDIARATHDCTDNVITLTTNTGNYRVAKADLSSAGYKRLDAFVDVCNPTGWWFHLADSPTCNGYGGDGYTTEHDAEAYNLDTDFGMYSTYDTSRGDFRPTYNSQDTTASSGCYRVQWTIYEDRVLFDDEGDPADTPRVDVRSIHGFESAPYAESDSEDPTGADANLWYVGMNRTVGSSSRTGTGTLHACFVLSTTTSPDPAVLSAHCPAWSPPPPVASLSCVETRYPSFTCTGSATGGSSPLTPYWQTNYGTWYAGGWTKTYICKYLQGGTLTVGFKVQDSIGQWSNTRIWRCLGQLPNPQEE